MAAKTRYICNLQLMEQGESG